MEENKKAFKEMGKFLTFVIILAVISNILNYYLEVKEFIIDFFVILLGFVVYGWKFLK